MNRPMSAGQLEPALSGEHMLQDLLDTRERAQQFYDRQVLDRLNEPMRDFIGQQQMMFVATSDARGACDSTLRAGPPGFVVVLDECRLAWPEYRGNGVMASRGNIVENPNVGLLFVDFVRDVIGLHVNGRADLVEDEQLRQEFPDLPDDAAPGRRPEHWVVTHVQEAYIHCSKHIPRLYEGPQPGVRQTRPSTKKSDYFAVTPGAVPGDRASSPAGGPAPSGDRSATRRPAGPDARSEPVDTSQPAATIPAAVRPPRAGWRRLSQLLLRLRDR